MGIDYGKKAVICISLQTGEDVYHFFIDRSQVEKDKVLLNGTDVNHIKNVLRMKPGEEIKVSDGSNMEYHCRITDIESDAVYAEILSAAESFAELPSRIYLFQGLPKADKMELIIQKAVELGAEAIIPVRTSRTVVKLDEKKEQNRRKRWNAIAESAAKQSGRSRIPDVHPVMSFAQAVDFVREFDTKLIPYELAGDMQETKEIISGLKTGSDIAVFIGPEGGYDKEEIAYAMKNGLQPVTLGKRILRTETAGLTMLSIIMFELEAKK